MRVIGVKCCRIRNRTRNETISSSQSQQMIVPARFMNRKWFIKSAKCAQCSHRWGIFRWIPNKRNCTATFSVHRHRHPFKLHGMVRWWRISATASPPFDSTTRKTNYWLLQTIVDGVRVRSSNLICGVKKIIIDNFSTSEDSLQQQQWKSNIEISSIYFSNEFFPAVRPK